MSTTRFPQQGPANSFSPPRSAPTPQHGQKAGMAPVKIREPRSFQPRPAH